jgi:ribosomal protein S18 acetylase RimI-like enzyme
MISEPLSSLALRAETGEDEAFLFALYANTREEELSATGWPPQMREAFLIQQFKAMRQGYATLFPKAQFSIILAGGQAVGRQVVDRGEQEILLVDIALLAGCRSQRIGTVLVGRLLEEAAAAGKPVNLSVLQNNRAARLYQRLGFQFIEQSGMHQRMRWVRPGPGPA